PATRAIPDVIQYTTYEAAAQALTSAGFTPVEDDVNSDKPAGTVLGSTPKAGVMVVPGTTVKVQTSNGRSGLPQGVGKKVDEVQILLAQMGYTNVKAQVTPPDDGSDYPSGSVWKSDPVAGVPVTKDQQVTLFVVPEKAAPPAPTITNIQPTGGPAAGGTD